MQVRILSAAKDAPRLAATLVSTSYNIGIAAGAFLGAVLLNDGLGYDLLPTAGIVCSALALVRRRRLLPPRAAEPCGSDRMSPALLALFAAAFAIGTSEFVIAGILPAVSGDLAISHSRRPALLVSLYALGVAIGGPLLAIFTGRFPRKRAAADLRRHLHRRLRALRHRPEL